PLVTGVQTCALPIFVRLEFAAGKAAFDAVRKQSEDVKRAAEIFGVPADQLVSTAERVVSEWKELRKISQRTTDEQAAAKAREARSDERRVGKEAGAG